MPGLEYKPGLKYKLGSDTVVLTEAGASIQGFTVGIPVYSGIFS